MVSENPPPELLGFLKQHLSLILTQNHYFQKQKYVRGNLPFSFRLKFKCINNYVNPIHIDEIWALRDKGKIWTIQQSRGDAVGVHACIGISKK